MFQLKLSDTTFFFFFLFFAMFANLQVQFLCSIDNIISTTMMSSYSLLFQEGNVNNLTLHGPWEIHVVYFGGF